MLTSALSGLQQRTRDGRVSTPPFGHPVAVTDSRDRIKLLRSTLRLAVALVSSSALSGNVTRDGSATINRFRT